MKILNEADVRKKLLENEEPNAPALPGQGQIGSVGVFLS